LFEEWEQLREKLTQLFKEKNETRDDCMRQGIQLLSDILNKAEGAAPINFQERFDFIQMNKNNYTAFRQLDELFKEAKKKIAATRTQA
jgi:hypothetical protein